MLLAQYGKEAFDEYISRYGRTGSRRDLLTKLIAGNKDVGPLADNEIVNEMTNLIFAGTDTTSNTFSYLLYRLAKHPHWQRQLQTELSTFSSTDIPHYRDVKALPILDAIVHETLRVHPAAPASLQRIVPVEGSMIDGVNMPGKVNMPVIIIGCKSISTDEIM
jgi:cytochrome P450